MIVLVCGGRSYQDRVRTFAVLDEIDRATSIDAILHGACGWDWDDPEFEVERLRGADRWAHEWASERGRAVETIAAQWRRCGPRAGPERNAMLIARGPDLVVAMPGGRGTADTVRRARAAGVVVREVVTT